MAFSTALLRRAASSAGSHAARALGGRRDHYPIIRPLAQGLRRCVSSSSREVRDGSSSPFSSRFFSSLAKSSASPDAKLLKVIDSEIKCAEESDDHDQGNETPDRFPFEIKDSPGTSTITLTRDYHGEAIKVAVSMPDLVTGEEDDKDDGDDDDDNDEKGGQSSIPLIVNVSKGDGTGLEFCCTAYPDEVVIDSMSVKEGGDTEEHLLYEGPDFSDLDENLQKAFHKYLEIRGISPNTTNFLHEYMINKDSREYLLWLKNLKKFVAK